jgi:hypothetical protein
MRESSDLAACVLLAPAMAMIEGEANDMLGGEMMGGDVMMVTPDCKCAPNAECRLKMPRNVKAR